MNRVWHCLIAFAAVLAACSGTESGNPTRTSAGCVVPIVLEVSDSVTMKSVGTRVTVNGVMSECAAGEGSSTCELHDPSFAHVGEQELVVSAPGYAERSLRVTVPSSQNPVCATGETFATVALDPKP